MKYAVVEPQY